MSTTVQSSSVARQGFRRGGRMNPGAPVEKPKDGKKTFGRMLAWFRPEWGYVLCLALAVLLAVGASVVGPSLQSSAIDKMAASGASGSGLDAGSDSGYDEYFERAGRFVIEKDKASIGMLQRVLKIGFNRAARIMDQLADAGVVSQDNGTRARQVLMNMPQFEQLLEEM